MLSVLLVLYVMPGGSQKQEILRQFYERYKSERADIFRKIEYILKRAEKAGGLKDGARYAALCKREVSLLRLMNMIRGARTV